jgi:hypothetical protein
MPPVLNTQDFHASLLKVDLNLDLMRCQPLIKPQESGGGLGFGVPVVSISAFTLR